MQFISKFMFFTCIIAIEYLATTSRHFEVVEKSWDKANHFLAFFILFLLLSFAYPKFKLTYKSILLLLFGLQIESVQHFLPFREFSFFDIFADGVGLGIGGFIYPYVKKWYDVIFK